MSAHFNRLFETSLSPGASASKQTMQHLVMATVECSLDNNNKKITVKFTVSRARLGVFLSVHLYSLAEIQNASQKKGEEERGANKISEWVATINVWQHFISYNALQSGNVGFQHWNLLFAAVFVKPSQCVFFKRRQSAKPRQVFFFFTWEILQ